MRTARAAQAALLGLFLCSAAAVAAENDFTNRRTAPADFNSLREYGDAKIPSGFVNLCARQPEYCQPLHDAPRRILLSPDRWQLITSVNREINHRIESTTDQKLYGQVEYWTLPDAAGDCEDYVLLKRKRLLELGFPATSLLITVVLDENGEGHAVMTIPTSSGDFVLDNRRDDVRLWKDAGYTFLKRQSKGNPNRWVSLARQKLQATNFASAPEAP